MTRCPGGPAGVALGLVLLVVGCAERRDVSPPEEPRPPVEVRAGVDRAVATTGDLIDYRISVDAEAGYEVDVPEAGAEIAGFRIVDVGREQPQERRGRRVEERWYQLRADLVGSYVLPPVTVRFRPAEGEADWQTLATSEIFVEVESVLPADGEAEDIRGLKPLRRVLRPTPWSWIALAVVGLSLAAGLLWLWLRRRRRAPPQPAAPPHELAFQALDALRRLDLDEPETIRRFYFRISEVVRAYVEGRFGLNATDLTTEEILRRLPELGLPQAELQASLRQFLIDTDGVKFAHLEPADREIETTYERALSFVEATRPAPEEPEEEAA